MYTKIFRFVFFLFLFCGTVSGVSALDWDLEKIRDNTGQNGFEIGNAFIDLHNSGSVPVGPLAEVLEKLEPSPELLGGAFEQMHGEAYASGIDATIRMQRRYERFLPNSIYYGLPHNRSGCAPIGQQCSCAIAPGRLNSWASVSVDFASRSKIGSFDSYDQDTFFFAAGVNKTIADFAFLGYSIGYDRVNADFDNLRSDLDIDAFRSMIYGGYNNGYDLFDYRLGYSRHWHKVKRNLNFGTGNDRFSNRTKGKKEDDLISFGLRFGRKIPIGDSFLVSHIGLDYLYLHSDSCTESGGDGAGLSFSKKSYNSARVPIGVKMYREVFTGKIRWIPEFRMEYIGELADDSISLNTRFSDALQDRSFSTKSGSWGRHSGRFGCGLNVRITQRWSCEIDYDYEIHNHTDFSELTLLLKYSW